MPAFQVFVNVYHFLSLCVCFLVIVILLCDKYELSAADLAGKWDAFKFNNHISDNKLNNENLEAFTKKIEADASEGKKRRKEKNILHVPEAEPAELNKNSM